MFGFLDKKGEKAAQLLEHNFLIAALITLFFILTPPCLIAAPAEHVLWTHIDSNGSTRSGVNLNSKNISYSSPVIAEIDGNPDNGKEAAIGSADGMLHVVSADGELLWQVSLPNQRCTKTGSTNKLMSTPAVGELFGDGIPYVVIGYGGVGGGSCGGGVMAFRGSDGTKRWHLNLKRFSKKRKFWANMHSVFSSPALADTNGNGKLEIGFGSFDRNVYLLNARGRVIWYYHAADTVWSSATFANVDDTPVKEMIIGTDISGNTEIKPPTKDGGYVYAFRTTRGKRVRAKRRKRKSKKYNFRDSNAYVWQSWFNQTIFSTPVVADVLPAHPGTEIVIGSGCYFPAGSSDKRGKWVKILSSSSGKVLQTLNTTACLSSTPAVADVDEDGLLEVVATVNGSSNYGGDGDSRIMAWNPESSEPFWEIIPQDNGKSDSYGAHFQSPVVADVDNNGSLEVLVANSRSVGIYSGKTGAALTCWESGCPDGKIRLQTRGALKNTPAVADLNGDGTLEVVIGGGSSTGLFYAWSHLEDQIDSNPGSLTPNATPWPMFRGNALHSGVFGE